MNATINAEEIVGRIREKFPRALLELPVWLLWQRCKGSDGKTKKIPHYADGARRSGTLDSPEDRARMVTFEVAAKSLFAHAHFAGLGIALGEVPSEDLRVCGIDLDHVYRDGELDPRAYEILSAAESYAEKSPGGEGLHILGVGNIGTTKKVTGLEIYSGGRFFTVTGETVNRASLADLTEAAAVARKAFHVEAVGGNGATGEVSELPGAISAGARNNGLTSLAGKLRRVGATEAEILAGIISLNARCTAPLPENELRSIAHSVARYPSGNSEDAQPIALRSALEIAAKPTRAAWVLKPYVERAAMILMVGAEGTFKSFLALHWALTIACAGELVIYLSAEGRGLWKRLRAWSMHHYPKQHWMETLRALPFLALERPINLSSLAAITTLISAVDAVGKRPALVVIDTMARNSDGSVERSTEDAQIYLNGLDQHVRARYDSAVILIHHIGHAVRDRARGPFVLIGSTDANFLLERPNIAKPFVTVRAGRMKDCEPPAPFAIEAHVVTLDETDEDGNLETSLILKASGNVPPSRPLLTGKNQKALLAELERRAGVPDGVGIWTEGELREIGRGLGMHKNSARDAVLGLRSLGYLTPTIGGSRLAHMPEQGPKDRNRAEGPISSSVPGPKTGTKAQASLEAVSFGPSSGPLFPK